MEAKTKSAKSGKTEIRPDFQNKADWNLFSDSTPGLKYSLLKRFVKVCKIAKYLRLVPYRIFPVRGPWLFFQVRLVRFSRSFCNTQLENVQEFRVFSKIVNLFIALMGHKRALLRSLPLGYSGWRISMDGEVYYP